MSKLAELKALVALFRLSQCSDPDAKEGVNLASLEDKSIKRLIRDKLKIAFSAKYRL